MPHRLDIIDFIANADYLVQLSDTEGYSYSIVEALSVGTPVICTAFAVAEEQGIVNGKTGFILPMDMSDIPVDAIYKGVKFAKVKPRESHYEEVLAPGACEYADELEKDVPVRCSHSYFDIALKKTIKTGEKLVMSRERAEYLEEKKLVVIEE